MLRRRFRNAFNDTKTWVSVGDHASFKVRLSLWPEMGYFHRELVASCTLMYNEEGYSMDRKYSTYREVAIREQSVGP